MLRVFQAAIPLVLTGFLAGCQDEGDELLSAPAGANAATIEAACEAAPEICELIEALFPAPGLENAALTRFGNIARVLGQGELGETVAQTFDLIGYIFEKDLDDPNGGAPPTTDEGRIELANLLLEFIGLNGIFPVGSEDFAWQICEPGVKCVFETESQFAGFSGTFTELTLVTISLRTDDPFDPLGVTAFPLIFDFSTTGISDATGGPILDLAQTSTTLAEPATVAVCVVDPPDPAAPSEEEQGNLALGHVIGEGTEGAEVEILPDAPPGDFALDCEGASSGEEPPVEIGSLRWWGERAGSAFEPVSDFLVTRLLANPGERRGLITAFSPVGGIDTRTVGDGGDGGPTTTTLLLNGEMANTSITHGQTATATAIVDPAPGNELEPSVTFVFSQLSGGPGPPTSTKFLDDGEASVIVQCDVLDSLPPPDGGIEISTTRFVRAEFPGAGDFGGSTSNTLILGCSAPSPD
jgi:hypothetical protein